MPHHAQPGRLCAGVAAGGPRGRRADVGALPEREAVQEAGQDHGSRRQVG